MSLVCSMPVVSMYFMWISWGSLFLCIMSTFAWLQMQPTLYARRTDITLQEIPVTQVCGSRITPEKKEHILRVCIKVWLVLSIFFIVLYFIVLISENAKN